MRGCTAAGQPILRSSTRRKRLRTCAWMGTAESGRVDLSKHHMATVTGSFGAVHGDVSVAHHVGCPRVAAAAEGRANAGPNKDVATATQVERYA